MKMNFYRQLIIQSVPTGFFGRLDPWKECLSSRLIIIAADEKAHHAYHA